MIHEILATLRTESARSVMIGDTIHDLQMAANAGIAGIGVASGAHSRVTLATFNPFACLGNVSELLTIL